VDPRAAELAHPHPHPPLRRCPHAARTLRAARASAAAALLVSRERQERAPSKWSRGGPSTLYNTLKNAPQPRGNRIMSVVRKFGAEVSALLAHDFRGKFGSTAALTYTGFLPGIM